MWFLLERPVRARARVIVDAVHQIERRIGAARVARNDDGDDDAAFEHKFWLTNGGRLIAGMQYLGQWEQRCER
jgi:hypothetical protein